MRYIRAYSKTAPSNGNIPMFERESSHANEFAAARHKRSITTLPI